MGTDGMVHFSTEEELTKEQLINLSERLLHTFGGWVFKNGEVHLKKQKDIQFDTYIPEAKHVYAVMDLCGFRYSWDCGATSSWPLVHAAIKCLQTVDYITNVYYGRDTDYVFEVLTPEHMERVWVSYLERMDDDL